MSRFQLLTGIVRDVVPSVGISTPLKSVSLIAAVVLLAPSATASAPRQYTAAELPRILAAKPPVQFPGPPERGALGRSDLGGDLPGQAAFKRALERNGFQSGYTVSWGDGLASGTGLLFPDERRAKAGLAAVRSFVRTVSTQLKGRTVTAVPATGLGVESWGLRGDYRDGGELEAADFGWRRGNLVLWAGFDTDEGCSGCDIVGDSRAYAKAIDARAKKR